MNDILVTQVITRFNMFTDEELDAMEEAFCIEGLKIFVFEIRREREYRESRKAKMRNKYDRT